MPVLVDKTSQDAADATERRKGAERRRAPRVRLDSEAELVVCPASSRTAPLKVQVRDVSATGVGILHDEPLPLGQKYVVREPTISRLASILFTVVRTDRVGENRYSIGLHASQLLAAQNGYVPGEPGAGSALTTNGMAKLLLLAVLLGWLAAAWSVL